MARRLPKDHDGDASRDFILSKESVGASHANLSDEKNGFAAQA